MRLLVNSMGRMVDTNLKSKVEDIRNVILFENMVDANESEDLQGTRGNIEERGRGDYINVCLGRYMLLKGITCTLDSEFRLTVWINC